MPDILVPVRHRLRERRDPDQPVIMRPDDLDRLLSDETLADWIADELVRPGAVLAPIHGPSPAAGHEPAPLIGHSALTTMVRHTLRDAQPVVARIMPGDLRAEARKAGAGSESHARLEQGARLLARLVSSYWVAVRDAFPTAWADRDDHVLWSSAGLTALSRLGAEVIALHVERHEILPAYFAESLQTVSARVSLARDARPAMATHPAADQLLAELLSALRGPDAAISAGRFATSAPWSSPASPASA